LPVNGHLEVTAGGQEKSPRRPPDVRARLIRGETSDSLATMAFRAAIAGATFQSSDRGLFRIVVVGNWDVTAFSAFSDFHVVGNRRGRKQLIDHRRKELTRSDVFRN
jgi:hypothetical protein